MTLAYLVLATTAGFLVASAALLAGFELWLVCAAYVLTGIGVTLLAASCMFFFRNNGISRQRAERNKSRESVKEQARNHST